jgi:iron complex transport system substrate-binding protein
MRTSAGIGRLLLALVLVLIVVIAVAVPLYLKYGRSTSPSSTPTGSARYYPLTLQDINTSVTIPSFPVRIVSLAPSDTQILVALGLSKYLVGIDVYSYQLLEEINMTSVLPKNITVIGEVYPAPNTSAIVALRPDIVVDEEGLIGSDYSAFTSLGFRVILTNADLSGNYTQIEEWVTLLGRAFDRNTQSQELVSWMNQKIQGFMAAGNVPTAYLLWINPDYSFYTAAPDVFVGNIIHLAGGVDVFRNETGYPDLPPPALIDANPRVIISQEVYNTSYTLYMLSTWPGIRGVPAYNQSVYIMSQNLPTDLLNEPGPLSVYAILMVRMMLEGEAPHYLNSHWVLDTLNVTLPVFVT